MNDSTNDPVLMVSGALQGSRDHLDTEQIAKRVPLSSQQIAAALKQLARQGQIEVLPAGTKRPARYGWLATTPRVIAPATPPTELTEQALGLAASAVFANKSSPLSFQDQYAALRDDIARTLRGCGLPELASVTAESDLAMAVARLAQAQQAKPRAEAPATPVAPAYLIRATKRRPRVIRNADAAQAAALAPARGGARRAEVFQLIPVGHARRGADWVEP